MNPEQAYDLIRNAIGAEHLCDYLTSPSSHNIGVYADGSVVVGDSVGLEIDPDERPIASVKCPGADRLDMAWWEEGWDTTGLSQREIVLSCCESGSCEDLSDRLISRLIEDYDEYHPVAKTEES